MFDSILKQKALPKPKYAMGLCIALSVHLAALLAALWLPPPTPPSSPGEKGMEVLLYTSLPPHNNLAPTTSPSLPLLAPPEKPAPPARELKNNKVKPFAKPIAILTEKMSEKHAQSRPEEGETPLPSSPEEGGIEDEEEGGAGGAEAGGAEGPYASAHAFSQGGGGGGGGAHVVGAIPFGEGMVAPKLVREPLPIRFSREALEARVEGRALVRCTISVQGKVENCRFLQRLPYMDEAILSALYMRQYLPATYQGKKISVDYNIPIRLKLP